MEWVFPNDQYSLLLCFYIVQHRIKTVGNVLVAQYPEPDCLGGSSFEPLPNIQVKTLGALFVVKQNCWEQHLVKWKAC